MKPRYSSNSGIFEKRGDPWISAKEGQESFGRNLETENPDYDCFTRAKPVIPKDKFVDPKPEKPKTDYQRQKVNAIRAGRTGRHHGVIKVEATPRRFNPCPGCRRAICIARGMCNR